MNEIGSSFDLTEFADFNAKSPIWMEYSEQLRSLIVYYEESPYVCYIISLPNGSVSRFTLPQCSDGAREAKNVLAIQESSDNRVLISYLKTTSGSNLQLAELKENVQLLWYDTIDDGSDNIQWNGMLETGMIYLVPEETKTKLHTIIIHTHCDGTLTGFNGVIGVAVKSEEDSDWHTNGDPWAIFTIDTDTTVAITNGASTHVIGRASGTEFNTPCLAIQGRYYKDAALLVEGTHYTITDTRQVTLVSALVGAEALYCYYENEPQPLCKKGDILETSEDLHYISHDPDVSNVYNTVTVTTALSAGTEAAKHYRVEFIPNGDGECKFGINKLVNGVKLKILFGAYHSGAGNAGKNYKITGITLGHTPAGQKTLE